MIGIIGAMEIEVNILRERMENRTVETVSGIDFIRGTLDGKEAVIAKSGVGKVFAALCTEAMIIKYSPSLIINTGIAGSLSDKLGPLDVALAESVIQHDLDTSAVGDPVGMISGINVIDIRTDTDMRKAIESVIREMGISCVTGTIASGDKFIGNAEDKKAIHGKFPEYDTVACEMEGAPIGQVCYVNEIPFIVIRTISDNGDCTSHIEYDTFSKQAAKTSADIVEKFILSL